MSDKKFPRFFIVDDIPVKVDYDKTTNEIFGINIFGNSHPPLKALNEGREISYEEFLKLSKELT